ncbi:MAG: cyclic nucleotide-binding domain-containing protein [Acidimicrobiales bacterium]
MASETVTTSFTSVSWIPSEAMDGFMRLPMDVGLGRYDQPPPDRIDDLEALVADGRCRFANRITGWAEIEDGRIVASGSSGGGLVSATEVGPRTLTFNIAAIPFPEIRTTESDGEQSVTFIQTAGGRTGAPFPRRAGKSKRFRLTSPTAWTTLAVTIRADGSTDGQARGASAFPRHWFYGDDGELTAKSATIDFADWTAGLHDQDTPWGDADREVLAAASESALERVLSTVIMQGEASPTLSEFEAGRPLMTQGEQAESVSLIVDGMVEIEVDGTVVGECGPGCVVGERAFLENGSRTATVRALSPVKVATVGPDTFGPDALVELRAMHRRELELERATEPDE